MVGSFYSPLSQAQVEQIHRSALQVLDQAGVWVESAPMLALLAQFGGRVNLSESRVRFKSAWVEQFIQDSEKYDWSAHQPFLRANAFFAGYDFYLNPDTDRLEPFTERTFTDYIRLARGLSNLDVTSSLGIPFIPDGIPADYGPLSERLFDWKYGAQAEGTVEITGLCPYLEEMYARRAEETREPLGEIFRAVGFLVSPLRLPSSVCEQLLYFHSRGLPMGVSHLRSLGGTAPITVAGASVLNLSECLFLNILSRALWGGRALSINGSTMVLDLTTTAAMYGRPEQVAVSSIMGQMARFYGAQSGGHGGLSDSTEPSVQAGMQKALSAMAGVLSCGGAPIIAGLLGVDTVCSPEQLVYDAELAGAMRSVIQPVEVSPESCAVDDIMATGPGGNFLGSDLTVARFRTEVWQPDLWTRESLPQWLRSGAHSDRERAKQRIREILAQTSAEPLMSEECERDLRAIISRAVAARAAMK